MKRKYDEIFYNYNLSYIKALAAVRKDGDALQYVKEQTPEICLATVVFFLNWRIKYIKDLYYEI